MQSAHVRFGLVPNQKNGPTALHAFFACAESMKGAYSLEKRCGVVGIKSVRACYEYDQWSCRCLAGGYTFRIVFSISCFMFLLFFIIY